MPTKSDLMHYRLQAILREHSWSDLEYLGEDEDHGHMYRLGEVEVPVKNITEFECEPVDESDTV